MLGERYFKTHLQYHGKYVLKIYKFPMLRIKRFFSNPFWMLVVYTYIYKNESVIWCWFLFCKNIFRSSNLSLSPFSCFNSVSYSVHVSEDYPGMLFSFCFYYKYCVMVSLNNFFLLGDGIYTNMHGSGALAGVGYLWDICITLRCSPESK